MNLFLEMPDETTLDLADYDCELDVATQIMAILASGYDWVKLKPHDDKQDWCTEFTVMERGPEGEILYVGKHDFEGDIAVLDNTKLCGTVLYAGKKFRLKTCSGTFHCFTPNTSLKNGLMAPPSYMKTGTISFPINTRCYTR